MDKTDKKSFYFGDTLSSLRMMYTKGAMSEINISKTKTLILLGYTKLASKDNKMNVSMIRTIKKDVLPKRDSQEVDME